MKRREYQFKVGQHIRVILESKVERNFEELAPCWVKREFFIFCLFSVQFYIWRDSLVWIFTHTHTFTRTQQYTTAAVLWGPDNSPIASPNFRLVVVHVAVLRGDKTRSPWRVFIRHGGGVIPLRRFLASAEKEFRIIGKFGSDQNGREKFLSAQI